MVRKIFLENPGQYLSPKIKANLKNLKKEYMDKDLDFFFLITADKTGVGLGKSTLQHLLSAFMDLEIRGLEARRYNTNHIFFDEANFRLMQPYLKPGDCFGFDEPDAFFSLEGGTRKQRRLKLKMIHIRQQLYFMSVCTDSLFTVGPWVRPGMETRINAILRIVRRGVVYLYSGKTGTMQKIKFDTKSGQRRIVWPAADLIFFFKPIPKSTEWWKDYIKRKNAYLKQSEDNPRAVRLMQKQQKKRMNTLTLSDIADIQHVHKATVEGWNREGYFGKRGVYKGVDGMIRIKLKAYNAGMKRIERHKNTVRRGPKPKKKSRKVKKLGKLRKIKKLEKKIKKTGKKVKKNTKTKRKFHKK